MDRKAMKNILILCDAFPPAFNPRMGYLCRYLPQHGWNPVVVTEYVPDNIFNNLQTDGCVNYINFFWKKNDTVNRLKYILTFFAELLFNFKNRRIKKEAEKIIATNSISCILSSVSFRAFPAMAGFWLAKKHGIRHIVDFRDIYEQFPNREYSGRILFRSAWINRTVDLIVRTKYMAQRNRIMRRADALTTVSEWHRHKLLTYNSNVSLIYNGFDDETFYFKPVANSIFSITYAGRIESEAVKDPSLLFQSVASLYGQNLIQPEKFRLQFYLLNRSSKEIIEKMTRIYRLEKFVDIYDNIPNSKVPGVLNRSSILLLLANRATAQKSPKGIMGTKVYEYIASEKPVLCVRNDESILESVIKSTNAGISASTVDQVNSFIIACHAEWMQNGFTHRTIDRQSIEIFTRRYQAGQFVQLFNSLQLNQ